MRLLEHHRGDFANSAANVMKEVISCGVCFDSNGQKTVSPGNVGVIFVTFPGCSQFSHLTGPSRCRSDIRIGQRADEFITPEGRK